MKKITLLCAFMAVLGVSFVHAAPGAVPVSQSDSATPAVKDSAAKYYRLAMASLKDPNQTQDFKRYLDLYDMWRKSYLSGLHTLADSSKFMNDMVESAGIKKDTTYVGVAVMQKTDTLPVQVEIVGWFGRVKVKRGHALVSGVKNMQNQWIQQPSVVYVNKRYRKIRQRVLLAF